MTSPLLAFGLNQFFEIRLSSVAMGTPLAHDIYLQVNHRPVLFRRRGDVLTAERARGLQSYGGEKFLIPTEQRPLYLDTLKTLIRSPDSTTEMRSRYIKESAFLHVHDLFTKEDVSEVVGEAESLVAEMVSFVSTDLEAVTSLLRLSTHDYYTYNHCVDVAVYSIVLAKKIFGEEKKRLLVAGLGGLLHDIGKRKIDSAIINKKGGLTPQEWDEIKRHPVYGKECLADVPAVPDESKLIVFQHHENFDGTGYPAKIAGDTISPLARIVTIADVFDALTTKRSYHSAITPAEAINTMFGMQPGKFDPEIFKSFNKNFDKKSNFVLGGDFDPCGPDAFVKSLRRK